MFLFPIISQASNEFDNITNKKMVDKGYFEKNLKSSGYWNLEFKIHVDNNWSETEATYEWCSGSGTWSDPYIIENVIVNGGNSGSPILIENSKVYFRIKNCTFYNSGSGYYPLLNEGGIKMVNVTKGTIINNTAFDNRVGMVLDNSENNTLSGNTPNNNNGEGILLYRSNNNLVWGNTVNNNNGAGIRLYRSNNNTISGNTVNNNNGAGIYLYIRSNNNLVWGNIVNNNNEEGIRLYLSDNNILSGNTANNNNGAGIYLYQYNDNNNISENIANNNIRYGILLEESNNNLVWGNTANNNKRSGMYLHHSDNNTLSGNTANYNSDRGIFLHYGNNNTISGNIAINNYYGINLIFSNYNDIIGNKLFDNNICYSKDETSRENTFKSNLCVKNEPSEADWIISGVIGIIITSIILIGLSVLFWQFKRKVK